MKSLDKLLNNVNSLNLSYTVQVGVFDSDSKRKEIISIGLNNAELMYIHENGNVNLPARPVLQMTVNWANKNIIPQTINKCVANVLALGWKEPEIEAELNRMCMRIESYARKLIKDRKLTPLKHPRKDGSDIPLLDTGQLMRSITCKLVKNV